MLRNISLITAAFLYFCAFVSALDIIMERNSLHVQASCFYLTTIFGFLYGGEINAYFSLTFLLFTNIITACILYTADIKKKISISIFVFVILASLYCLLDFDYEILKAFTVFIICFIFKQFRTVDIKIINTNQLVSVFFPLISLFIIISLKDVSIILIILLIVSCLFTLFLFTKLSVLNQLENDKENISRNLEIKNSDLIYIKELYSEQRKLSHDYKNKLVTIKALIDEGNINAAREYTDTLLEKLIYQSKIISTNSDIIDALLNSKYYLCRKKSITMQFRIDDLSHIPLSNDELIVILSNALDNAIEASAKTGNPFIKLKIENNEIFVISIINSSNDVVIKNNSVIKKHSLEHGYGLENIKSLVEKYHGNLALDYKDSCFQLTIII